MIRRTYRTAQQTQLNSRSNATRYFRVMALSCVDIFANIPLFLCMIISDSVSAMEPWVSWHDTKRGGCLQRFAQAGLAQARVTLL